MKIPSLYILTVVGILLLGAAFSQADSIVAVDSDDGLLYEIDPDTGAISNPVLLPYQRCDPDDQEYSAMARHPATGDFYLVINENPGILAVIDSATGVITPIGNIGTYKAPGKIPSITFGPGDLLYAISGETVDSDDPGSIHVVNQATGATTATGWVTQGDEGHAIEYNSDDGMIYHFFKESGVVGLEKINPATGAATEVTLSGTQYDACNGLAYGGGGTFYVLDGDADEIFTVSDSGVSASVGTVVDIIGTHMDSLVYESGALFAINQATLPYLIEIDPTDASIDSRVVVGSTPCSRNAQSIAQDPITGDFYILTDVDFPTQGQALAKVDISTGALTDQVTLSHNNLSEIAFDASGTLYGIGGKNLALPNQLLGGQMATINRVTGLVSELSWPTGRFHSEDHTLAFNPDDGLFYHFYTNGTEQVLESVDPMNSGAAVTVATLTADNNNSHATAAAFTNDGDCLFSNEEINLSRVTTAGALTEIIEDIGQPYSIAGLTAVSDQLFEPVVSATVIDTSLRDQLLKKMRKIRKKLKIAKRKMQVAKVKRFSSKLKKLKKQLRSLG